MSEIAWGHLHAGRHRLPCPSCARHDRDKTLGVKIEEGAGVAHCFRCQHVETWRDTLRSIQQRTRPQPRPAQTHATLSDFGRKLWAESQPLAGTIGASYLAARACVLPPADGDLRFHPALKHTPTGYTGGALLALVTDVRTREPISLHRTWINADGTKPVQPARMILKDHRKQGGVIRLWPDDWVTTDLGLAEGIETGLSLAHAYEPVWSVIDAGNLAAFPVLLGIQSLLIAADNDPAGIKGAHACASRWAAARVNVRITQQQANDLNDVARGAA